MKRKCFYKVLAVSVSLVLLLSISLTAAAASYEVPENVNFSYHYNVYGEAVSAPDFYTYTEALEDGFNSPGDLYILGNELYVLDNGNNRVVVMDLKSHAVLKEIVPAAENEGEKISLKDAQGLYVTENKKIYIALTDQKCVLVLNENGTAERKIDCPESSLIPSDFSFCPSRVAVQSDGLIYVVSEGAYQGIMQLSAGGDFISFFGSNTVEVTASTVINKLWRKLFNKSQQSRLENSLPADYSSIAIGSDGFIYSTTDNESKEEIKKHSPLGNNILKYNANTASGVVLGQQNYGDYETYQDGQTLIDTRFTDLTVGDNGIIYALDTQRGRIFAYDQNSNLLGIFGVVSDQASGFKTPVSIEEKDGTVYLLDKGRNQVMVFEPAQYAGNLITAASLYNDGLFAEAAEYWEKVRSENTNLALCAAGLGWAALENGNNRQAMAYFKEAQDKGGYNQAFLALRNHFIDRWFLLVFIIGLLAVTGVFMLISVQSKKPAFDVRSNGRTKLNPFQVMPHPFAGFEALKDEKMGSFRWSLIMLGALFAVRMFEIWCTGFQFNTYRLDDVNILTEFVQIMGVFIAWVLCNWAVGTLMDSEGRMSEIFNASAYALCPYIVFKTASVLISNCLVLREKVFVTGLAAVGIYISLFWMIISVMKTHKFSFGKTIACILLVLIGILFLLFLWMMFYSLVGQFATFIKTVYNEIQYRI